MSETNEHREQREDRQNRHSRAGLQAMALFAAVLMSTLNLGMLLWKGGALVERFESLHERVVRMEAHGSPLYLAHTTKDNMQQARNEERLSTLETTLNRVVDMQARLLVISDKLDLVKNELELHTRKAP